MTHNDSEAVAAMLMLFLIFYGPEVTPNLVRGAHSSYKVGSLVGVCREQIHTVHRKIFFLRGTCVKLHKLRRKRMRAARSRHRLSSPRSQARSTM